MEKIRLFSPSVRYHHTDAMMNLLDSYDTRQKKHFTANVRQVQVLLVLSPLLHLKIQRGTIHTLGNSTNDTGTAVMTIKDCKDLMPCSPTFSKIIAVNPIATPQKTRSHDGGSISLVFDIETDMT